MTGPRRTDYTILGCLALRPMSGYDVKRFVEEHVSHFWNESFGQIYPALRRLEEDGLASSEVVPGTGGPERRVYALTGAGLQELREWLQEEPRPDVPRYELPLKLFFGEQMPVEAAIEHVERYRSLQVELLEGYRQSRERMERELAGTTRLPYWRAVLRGGIRYAEMAIGWCDETLADLRELDAWTYPVEPDPLRPTSDPR